MRNKGLFSRFLSTVIAVVSAACLLVSIPAPAPVSGALADAGIETALSVSAAVSFPSLSESSYCETVAPKSVSVFKDKGLQTRGTCSPSKAYKACIDEDDVLFLYEITSSYIKVSYPTSNGRRTGYIARDALIGVSSPSAVSKADGKATTYVSPGGSSYGYFESGDKVYAVGTSGSYTAVIYTAKNSKGRGYKLGWAGTSDYRRFCESSSGGSGQSSGEAIYRKADSFVGRKYPYFEGLGFHYRAWCADFVSYCANQAGVSHAVPRNSSVSGLRDAIKAAGGKEYSKSKVQNGSYVPKRGDIIIFKSDGASHVGIVDCAKGGRIYYIDGNNTSDGNGNNACVHYSKCSYDYSKFTCVLHPNY